MPKKHHTALGLAERHRSRGSNAHGNGPIIDHTLLTAFYEKFIALQAPLPKDKHLVVPEESIHFFNMVGVGQLGMEAIVAAGMAAAGSSHDFLRTLGDLGMSTKEWTVLLEEGRGESLHSSTRIPPIPTIGRGS